MHRQLILFKTKSSLLIFVFIMIVSNLASGCSLVIQPADSTPIPPAPTYPKHLNPVDLVNVTFTVLIPAPLPDGEKLAVDILDEVSGLPLNINRHELEMLDETHYQTSISVALGSDIKYRYVRLGSSIYTEVNVAGTSVRYRMVHAVRGLETEDIITAWPDQPYAGTTGRLYGTVSSNVDQMPLPDTLIIAGGYQTFTDMYGKFAIEEIPVGVHNLVAYSIDGSYQTFQQGARIMENMATPADIKMSPLPLVTVTFIVTPPADAVGAPVRLAGNFCQLGNTFADLSGGVNTLASRMPVLSKLDDGRLMIKLQLHAGNDLRYKYTLGDGFWNSEQSLNGSLNPRQLIIPAEDVVIEDKIETWRAKGADPVLIQVTVPESTPESDSVSIQFNPHVWMEPIPMWPMGGNQWLYLLFSPLDQSDLLSYRFCRNDQCSLAYDKDSFNDPYLLDYGIQDSYQHSVSMWHNWIPTDIPTNVVAADIPKREETFVTGIEFLPKYHPSYQSRYSIVFDELISVGSNWIVLTPTWKLNDQAALPLLQPVPGISPLTHDMMEMIDLAQTAGLQVVLYPQIDFGDKYDVWWLKASKDDIWWQEWYSEYERFLLSYAKLADVAGVERLIIGGDQILPSLPGDYLLNGSDALAPAIAEKAWIETLQNVNTAYQGQILWALTYSDGFNTKPVFVDMIDAFYVQFNTKLIDGVYTSNLQGLEENLNNILDTDILDLKSNFNKAIMIGISYPSADGAAQACVVLDNGTCIDTVSLSPDDPLLNEVSIDLQVQVDLYNALCKAIIERDWIDGIISRGFFPPVKLMDASSSLNGKPAMDVLWYWYSGLK